MLTFAVITNSIVGIMAAGYILIQNMLFHAKFYLIIFPLLNILESFLILLMFLLMFFEFNELFSEFRKIGIESISDENTKINEVKIGIVATIIIFAVSQYIFKNYWAITFSICLAYVSFLNDILSRYFLNKKLTA